MDSPYRSAPTSERSEAPRDRGIVGDVVAQFADPLAFLRELVQNAIDAGSPAVEVELRHDAGAGALRAIVRDRGEGMDRDLLENHLLVLFRSTKDRDPTKIGKFGIGFSSVLAPGPRVVVVDTVRGGRRLVLHLHPDLTYQLFEGGPASRAGTTVELELPVEPGAVDGWITRSRDALVRWCRHAAVPITFTARGADGAVRAEQRIDRPLALDGALVEVRAVSADGGTHLVVGLLPGAAAYAGFFNRGLMLHETAAPLAGAPVAWKVMDPRLGHTLSRDDVRRDDVFDGAIALVQRLVARELPRAAAAALAEAADTDRDRWALLFEAIDRADLALADDAWVVPLVVPVGGAAAIAASALPKRRAWRADRFGPLVEALAAAGEPVCAVADAATIERIAKRGGRRLVDVEQALTLIELGSPAPSDRALLDGVLGFLAEAGRAPAGIALGALTGALADRTCVVGGRADETGLRRVIDRETGVADPFRAGGQRLLVLRVDDPLIDAARRRAVDAPMEAAALLARGLLRATGQLDLDRSTALLTATAARLGVT